MFIQNQTSLLPISIIGAQTPYLGYKNLLDIILVLE